MEQLLSIREVLVTAIRMERQAVAIYDFMLSRFDRPVLKKGFSLLVKEENKHIDILKDLYLTMSGLTKERSVEEFLGPLPVMPEFKGKSLREILEYALDQEKQSIEFYRKGAGGTSNPEVQNIFEQLIAFEEGHVNVLVKSIAHVDGFVK